MPYFQATDSLLTIVEKYPETVSVFTSNGFPQMDNQAKREVFAKSISLKTALMLKQIDYDTFASLLIEAIEGESNNPDVSLSENRLSNNKEAIKVVGALPCPVRIPLMEKFNSFTKTFKQEYGIEVESELKAASMGVDWIEKHVKEVNNPSDLPDIFISAGFDMFFDLEMFGKFKDQGIFSDFSPIEEYNEIFTGLNLKDPMEHFSLLGVVPAVFLVNTSELGDRQIPRTWQDIMKPEFENKVSLPVGDFDLFNGILLNIFKKYGDDGVVKLGHSLLESLHPSQMIKSEKKTNKRPIVTIMPYFFTKMVKENSTMQALWPEDGAIISPIFMLTKSQRKQEIRPIVDYFASQQVGEVLAHSGLFPSVNPDVDNRIPKENKFMWLGWDYIYSHDISATIKHCETLFQSSLKEKKMNLITVSGPPSSGKTSVILKTIESLQKKGLKVAVAKFDCLYTDDDILYKNAGIPVKKGLSGALCPDHYFVSNVEEITQWGLENKMDVLISESAGLCNRCSPYIKGIKAICVIDNLSGINTPKKIGPMLKSADIVVITKGDIVSQAEREVFASRVNSVNPKATIMHINGLTGQGSFELSTLIYDEKDNIDTLKGKELRFPMPSALCSYCLGETRIGESYQMGNVRKINLED